jgi:carbon storage regulator
MLVLSRKQGQSIVIGNDIVISVKEIRGRTVRISVETPDGMPVYREEIHREIVEENRRAAAAAAIPDDRLALPGLKLGRLTIDEEGT